VVLKKGTSHKAKGKKKLNEKKELKLKNNFCGANAFWLLAFA
jgi:hypothetical protein